MAILGYQIFYWALIAAGFHFFDWIGLGVGALIMLGSNCNLRNDGLAVLQLGSGLAAIVTACAWPELVGLLADAVNDGFGWQLTLAPVPAAYGAVALAAGLWKVGSASHPGGDGFTHRQMA